ncbi:MAG: hypothetical protein WB611_14425 [Stellaceae bacterium]
MSDCILVLAHVLCTLDPNRCNPEKTSRADGGLPNSANPSAVLITGRASCPALYARVRVTLVECNVP